MKKYKKGFTLIELLVVISIISLLSSIVMVSVTSARDKAKQNAFRSEVMQFVNALELFRNDYGDYPYEDAIQDEPFSYIVYNNNTYFTNGTGQYYPNFVAEMKKYIQTFPNPRGGNANNAFMYLRNGVSSLGETYRCRGSSGMPKYVIMISPTYWGSNFADWPDTEVLSFGEPIGEFLIGTKCFSLN